MGSGSLTLPFLYLCQKILSRIDNLPQFIQLRGNTSGNDIALVYQCRGIILKFPFNPLPYLHAGIDLFSQIINAIYLQSTGIFP